MAQEERQGQGSTSNRQRAMDEKVFAFYRLKIVSKKSDRVTLVFRETVDCDCPVHFTSFKYLDN